MKKKKKRFNPLVPIVVILTLILLGGAGLFIYSKFFMKDTRYQGTWRREVDLTDYVTDAMDIWLEGAGLDAGTDYGDTRVTVYVTLYLNEDDSWSEVFIEDSYEAAKAEAMEVAAAGLRDFLTRRIEATNTSMEEVGKTIDELIYEALGMTIEEYIELYGPILLPTVDDIKAVNSASGTYVVKNGIITRTYKDGSVRSEKYVLNETLDTLVLMNSTEEIAESESPTLVGTSIGTGAASDVENTESDESETANVKYPIIYIRSK